MRTRKKALWIIAFLMYFAALMVFLFTCWMVDTGTALDSFVFTVTAGLDGANPQVVIQSALPYVPRALGITAVILLLDALCHVCLKKVDVFIRINRAKLRITGALTAAVLALQLVIAPAAAFIYLDKKLLLLQYLSNEPTLLYDEHYVPAKGLPIIPPEEPRNLVFIWLESMENTYADASHGGAQPENLIPGLNALFDENAGFYGMRAAPFAQYTFGAMFAAASGTPNAFSLRKNTKLSETPAKSVPFLWDVLKASGYSTYYLLGSDSDFAGTRVSFAGHGIDRIYDLQTARDEGIVPQDYYVNWGLEDSRVFDIAKRQLTALADEGAPFCFMLSTMDTHYPVGYVCDLCEDRYSSATANVIACADRQVTSFVSWLAEQPYYENTVVIICGDHPRMDAFLVKGVPYGERTLYNCFINTGLEPGDRNRVFTQMDLFPTTLSALGFRIEGSRIGFGTDLFSGIPTLPEELGCDYFEAEIQKRSEYFLNYMQ